MTCWQLFWLYTQYGFLCLGGGYMLTPLIITDLVGRLRLISMETFGNLIAIAQVTPGPIGINSTTYIGYIKGGFWGSVAATLGLVTLPMLLACLAVSGIARWKDVFWIKGGMRGTRISAVGLLFFGATLFWGMSIFTAEIPWRDLIHFTLPENFGISWKGLLIFSVVTILMLRTKIPMTALILGSALAGSALSFL